MSKPSVADQMLIDWRREVLHENRRLRAAVDRVRALHKPVDDDRPAWCDGCGGDWPCATIRALDPDTEGTDHA